MFPLSPMAWVAAGAGVLIIALGLGVTVQTSRLDSCKTEAAGFKADVKAKGEVAEKARAQDIIDRQKLSDKQEQDNAKRFATQAARYRAALVAARVPRSDPDSSEAQPLSAAATQLGCPDRQPDVAGRLATLEEGILGLLQRGDVAIERTVTCKRWLDEQVIK